MAVSVLMVCLGNICRSPLAEGALRHHALQIGFDVVVDSAGTGDWHAGDPPDRRAQDVALRLGGLDISGLRARQVIARDFHRNYGELRWVNYGESLLNPQIMHGITVRNYGDSLLNPRNYGDSLLNPQIMHGVVL